MIKIEETQVVGFEAAIRGMRNPKNSWDRSDSGTCGGDNHIGCAHCASVGENEEYNDAMIAMDLTHGLGVKPCGRKEFDGSFQVGYKDLELAKKLVAGGSVHAKFRRMIVVYADVTAPLYWWKEYDTYKVGTVADSCSTMHKLTDKPLSLKDFSSEHLLFFGNCAGIDMPLISTNPYGDDDIKYTPNGVLCLIIQMLNKARELYLEADEKLKMADAGKRELTPAERKHILNQRKLFWWQMIQLLPSSYNQKRTIELNYEVLANIYRWRKTHKLDEWVEFCEWIETLPYAQELIIGGTVKE